MSAPPSSDLETHLERFGLSSFRRGQREVIDAVLAGRDCLCVMPTGGGKSLCYQLPAVAREGVTLVISPLIALMKDQVDALLQRGISATYINSSLPYEQQLRRMHEMGDGAYDLVYVAPERLRNSTFVEHAQRGKIALLAVDEAHCVSEWGHDFRPDYARLGMFRRRVSMPQTIALTATATPRVREDIAQILELQQPQTFVSGFARPNLRFEVQSTDHHADKDQRLWEFLSEVKGAGIIYASTRKKCEELVTYLRRSGRRKIDMYHAGLDPQKRKDVQDRFMAGKVKIIVATNAFGMGIDKSDLRFVVHYNLPGSLEAYCQEAGRAGRDGQMAICLLLYQQSDRYIQEFFIENSYPSREMVEKVYEFLRSHKADPVEMTLQQVKEQLDLSLGSEGVGACEQLLEKCGAIERLDSTTNRASVRIDSDLPTLVDLLPRDARVQHKVMKALEQIVGTRRFQRVYFHLKQLEAMLEMDRDNIVRAIRNVCQLKAVDYVQPFRGRAVHVPDRDKAFRELEIDFAELDARRAAEYQKLERMVRYATASSCRQLQVLDYFGDTSGELCGVCDNCTTARETGSASVVVDEQPAVLRAVRIILSGVARTKSRFGRRVVSQMLCGSKAKQITKFRLNQLSTFGLLKDLKIDEVNLLLGRLIDRGLVEIFNKQVGGEANRRKRSAARPCVRLTKSGIDVMKGVEPFGGVLVMPQETIRKLGGVLVVERSALKKPEAQPNTEPRPPAAREPESAAATASASPGTETMTESTVVAKRSPAVEEPTKHPAPVVDRTHRLDQPHAIRPSYYWTWRLLSDGFSMDECLQIRGVDRKEATEHLIAAAGDGLAVEASWALSDDQMTALDQVRDSKAKIAETEIRQILTTLPDSMTFEQVMLYLKSRP